MGKTWTKYMAFLTLLCVCVCIVLAVGVTYGRYQWEFPKRSYVFSPTLPDGIYICGGGISDTWINSGSLPPLADTWEKTDNGAELDFGVTNGQIEYVSQQEQTFVVRLAAGLSIKTPENITVTLSWKGAAGQTHSATATATPIEKGSLLYNAYGDGWIYQFFIGDTEMYFTLPGGYLQYYDYTITVSGDVDPTLLNLQILGQNSN